MLAAIPIFILAATVWSGSGEPQEGAMRRAFAEALSAQVRGAIAYAEEAGGAAALDRIRDAGTALFEVRSFTKLDCARLPAQPGHECGFVVEIGTVAGTLQQNLRGRFVNGPDGLRFVFAS